MGDQVERGDHRGDDQARCAVRLGDGRPGHVRLLRVHLVGRLPGPRSPGPRAAVESSPVQCLGRQGPVEGGSPRPDRSPRGDLVFFDTMGAVVLGNRASHVGMMIDAERFIHAANEDLRVCASTSWAAAGTMPRCIGARRIFEPRSRGRESRTPAARLLRRSTADWSHRAASTPTPGTAAVRRRVERHRALGARAGGGRARAASRRAAAGRGDGAGDAGDPSARRRRSSRSGTATPRTVPASA